MIKLQSLKSKMESMLVRYQGNEIALWEFAQLTLPFNNGPANFLESEKRQNLGKLISLLSELESDLLDHFKETSDIRQ